MFYFTNYTIVTHHIVLKFPLRKKTMGIKCVAHDFYGSVHGK